MVNYSLGQPLGIETLDVERTVQPFEYNDSVTMLDTRPGGMLGADRIGMHEHA